MAATGDVHKNVTVNRTEGLRQEKKSRNSASVLDAV